MKALLLIPLVFIVPKSVLVSGYIVYKVYDKRKNQLRVVSWGKLIGRKMA